MTKKKFKRQESNRFKRLKDSWRRPRGKDNKMRIDKKGKPSRVKVGYRKPKEERDIHPSGYRETLVENPSDLEDINPETHAARIGSTVGKRKRKQIIERAKELGIKLLNAKEEPEEEKEEIEEEPEVEEVEVEGESVEEEEEPREESESVEEELEEESEEPQPEEEESESVEEEPEEETESEEIEEDIQEESEVGGEEIESEDTEKTSS
ncbi:MAG: 50S ribosomal protein L32e [Hadesarchaea archaeon]|nr:50S ribosomal protein L32e [Hadesarchaea archaeon]